MKETQYLNWLIGQNWTITGPESPHEYCQSFSYTAESPTGSLEMYGVGPSPDAALDALENWCKEYITEIERNLNIDLVQNDS